jgi:hypothetical protein
VLWILPPRMEAWPDDFLCPISLEVMTDPIILPSGHTFERRSIQHWLNRGPSPTPVGGEGDEVSVIRPGAAPAGQVGRRQAEGGAGVQQHGGAPTTTVDARVCEGIRHE